VPSQCRAAPGGQRRQAENGEQAHPAADTNQTLGSRTICFSKTERMHDLVIGRFINSYEFGLLL
jgi:insertion element IS1 protein InsB